MAPAERREDELGKINRVGYNSDALKRFNPANIGAMLAPRRRHLVYMVVWAIAFALMNAADGVGDIRGSRGVPLWRRACDQDRSGACEVLATILTQHCVEGSAWACNKLGILSAEGEASSPLPPSASFSRACALGSSAGCENARLQAAGRRDWRRLPPNPADYVVLLQTEDGGDATTDQQPRSLVDRACTAGWVEACR